MEPIQNHRYSLLLCAICLGLLTVLIGVPNAAVYQHRRVEPITYSSPIQALVAGDPLLQRDIGSFGAFADFNRDGRLDWIRTFEDEDGRFCQFLPGDQTLSFGTPTPAISRTHISACPELVADVTADGILDLVTADVFGAGLKVFNGNGDGTFELLFSSTKPNDYHSLPLISILLADFNRDGRTDIATVSSQVGTPTSSGDSDLYLFLSEPSTPPFVEASHQIIGKGFFQAKVGDPNGDGYPDIVIANGARFEGSKILVAVNNHKNSFVVSRPFGDTDPQRINVLDVDGDRFDDVITFSPWPEYGEPPDRYTRIRIDYGSSNLQGSRRSQFDTANEVWVEEVGHFDNDRLLDIFGPEGSIVDIDAYKMVQGNGRVKRFPLPSGFVYIEPRLQDLNSDGFPDIFASGEVQGTYTVYGFFAWLTQGSMATPYVNSLGQELFSPH